MTLGTVSGTDSSSAVSFCSCCGAKMVPHFNDDAVESKNQINQLISESFLTVKGAALFLPRGSSPTPNSAPHISQRRNKHTGDLQKHLQTMFTVLRPEDTIRLAVRLESAYGQVTRYMVVVSTNGRQDTEESIVLGMDFVSSDSCCTVGLVLPLWSDTLIHLDGDGGFSVSTVNRVHVFKPVSVQAMWSALQSLHKACEVARCHNYYPGSLFLTWVSYYQSRVSSNQFCINEWNAMQDVESHRANSPILFTDLPTERERTERLIKMRLREIMMQKDLENVTCKEIRTELEMQMVCNLREFKEFIDNEMIVILGQMDSPTEIFDHVFLGSEWNASNLEELQNSGVRYILNVTREIDNFFPGMFEYHNIRVYDEEATNLLEYWNETYKFISKAKKAGAKCLVHCKMGVSRSASTVIAYAMKEYGWDLSTAFDYVKERRAVTKPNPSFMKQLEEYQGILLASKQRHNKLWRSHSDSDLSERPDSLCRPSCPSLARSDSQNNNASSPSLHHFLGVAVLQALGAQSEPATKANGAIPTESHPLANGAEEEEGGSDCEDAILLSLPSPRAATVVPDNSASVAVTEPVALPHPPPSLHILPPTPETQRARRPPPTHLPISVPKSKPERSLSFPERGGSGESSPLTLGSCDSDSMNQSLSDSGSDRRSPLSPTPSPTPRPLTLALAPSDANNNPSELPACGAGDARGEADGSSNHSADSIDFFSAREKFLGLAQDGVAQDGRARALSEPSQQRAPARADGGAEGCEDEEARRSQAEDGSDQTHPGHHDNGVSVRHIVTEIESISSNSASPSSSSSSSAPPCSSSPQPVQSDHQEEAEPPPGSVTPPSHPPSPSSLPCDWPVGSVRRATKQLEERLKQELEAPTQRSPLQSPSAEQPPPGSPLHPAAQSTTQGEKPKDRERHAGAPRDQLPEPPHISQVSGAAPVPMHTSVDSHIVTSSLFSASHPAESSLDTSGPSPGPGPLLSQSPAGQPAPPHLSLDGVTVRESDTDDRSPSGRGRCSPDCEAQLRLARGSQELERIQQTLRELQAFLHDGACLEAADGPAQDQSPRDTMDTEPDRHRGPSPPGPAAAQRLRERQEGRSLAPQAGWHRAMELEARIRQAGLTPPSIMKRSASLAKLDCLELSANDLSDLDLRPHTRPTSSHSQNSFSLSQCHPDDSWKKQKVLAQHTGAASHGAPSPPSSSSSSHGHSKEDGSERDEPEGGAPRQQGRGHSSRRSRKASAEKKQRAAALLYNTM
ncbi:uncharacterized protein ssh2a isoform 1-T1 [Menidia menidia]